MYKEGKSKSEISKRLNIRRATVIDWLSKEFHEDKRGWTKGKARKYTDDTISDRICSLKQKRIDANKYFVGSDYVRMDYDKTYPKDILPSKWYIDEVVRRAGKQTRKPKGKKPGGSEYLLYPKQCINDLGYVHQSADFIGKKYITGQTEPINIFSTAYYKPFKLFKIARVRAEKSIYAVEKLQGQWRDLPIPDVFRIDNGLQFRGTANGKRCVGIFLKFLLNLGIKPLFGSPSKPWTNPHIEGHNKVFNEKVWGRNFFTSLEQIDKECERFNEESMEYFLWRYPRLIMNEPFNLLDKSVEILTERLLTAKNKKVYFVRFVESFDQDNKAFIVILNETIRIPEKYTHQFVFVEWDLGKELLNIFSEYKLKVKLIMQVDFKLNI